MWKSLIHKHRYKLRRCSVETGSGPGPAGPGPGPSGSGSGSGSSGTRSWSYQENPYSGGNDGPPDWSTFLYGTNGIFFLSENFELLHL